jgi:hypothetical protein
MENKERSPRKEKKKPKKKKHDRWWNQLKLIQNTKKP